MLKEQCSHYRCSLLLGARVTTAEMPVLQPLVCISELWGPKLILTAINTEFGESIVQLEQLKVEFPLWEQKQERKKQTKKIYFYQIFSVLNGIMGEWKRCQRCSCNLPYADQSVLTNPGWLKWPWDQSSLRCWNSFFMKWRIAGAEHPKYPFVPSYNP